VSSLGPRLSPRARLRRLIISVAVVLLALLVVAASVPAFRQNALALLSAPTPTPTPPPRSTVAEPTFLTTQIAVLAPAPAHAGDAVTIIIRLQAAYDGHDAQRSYSASKTSTLYGPFPSLAALQGAVASRSNGPPSGTGLPLLGDLSTSITASDSGVVTGTFHLPRPLSPDFYDIVVIATLRGSRAAARTDVPLQIVAGG
jgi:hypothetical protein